MKVKEAGENYLEAILVISKEKGSVRSIDIAHHMNHSKPTISVAMKKLRDGGFITIEADGHLTLTNEGRKIAEKIYDRHEILAQVFIAMGVSPETAYEDACKVEHDLSDETFECLKAHANKFLNT